MSVTISDTMASRRTIAGQVLRTPMLPAPSFPALTVAEVPHNTRTSRSRTRFKERGALNLSSLDAAEPPAASSPCRPAIMPRRSPITRPPGHSRDHRDAVMTPFVKVRRPKPMAPRWCSTARASRTRRCAPRRSRATRPPGAPLQRCPGIAGQGTIALEMLEDAPDLETW